MLLRAIGRPCNDVVDVHDSPTAIKGHCSPPTQLHQTPHTLPSLNQVTNIGRDGVGGVMSCGQGSIWRVDVLRDGVTSDGKRGVDAMEVCGFLVPR